MRRIKLSSSVNIAAIAIMAFAGAGSASATALYEGTTKLENGRLMDYSLAALTRAKLTNTAGTETFDECQVSTVRGHINDPGGAAKAVSIVNGSILWEGCTFTTTTDSAGGFEVTQIGTSTEGTVKANVEFAVTINTVLFGLCKYGFKVGTHLGVLATTATGVAQLNINAVAVKLPPSEFVCPETAKFTASYYETVRENLRVESS